MHNKVEKPDTRHIPKTFQMARVSREMSSRLSKQNPVDYQPSFIRTKLK